MQFGDRNLDRTQKNKQFVLTNGHQHTVKLNMCHEKNLSSVFNSAVTHLLHKVIVCKIVGFLSIEIILNLMTLRERREKRLKIDFAFILQLVINE